MSLPAHNLTRWPERLPMDMALLLENSGDTMSDILNRYALTASDAVVFSQDKTFLKRVSELRGEVREHGLTFRAKAKVLAEEYLSKGYEMIHSPDVSPAVKADLIKSTVKWAGLEPKGDAATDGQVGGVSIQINLGGQTHTAQLKTVEGTTQDVIER